MKRSRPAVVATLALSAALLLGACGSETQSGSGGSTSSAPASESAASGVIGHDASGVTVEGGFGAKPTITIGTTTKDVTQLQVVDLVEGTGDPVAAHATVLADYAGVGAETTKTFDSSFDRGQPISFPLDGVIQGWGVGLVGMKKGGRRLLVIPGALAYGANPPTAAIRPNEVLVFVVDLVDYRNPTS